MKDECWLKEAIWDDTLVADLLLRLKDSGSGSDSDMKPSLPLTWGSRQPRSKSSSSSSSVDKKRQTRLSPTTPLSWGGAASPSDGCDESTSHPPPPSDRFRSKISVTTEAPTTTSKRPRRKKTFAELKEEEASLLKERTYLKKELTTLQLTLKEQRLINDNFKRMKLDLHVKSGVKSEANSIEREEHKMNHNGVSEVASSNASRQVKSEDDELETHKGVTSQEELMFVLPDLNMIPDD